MGCIGPVYIKTEFTLTTFNIHPFHHLIIRFRQICQVVLEVKYTDKHNILNMHLLHIMLGMSEKYETSKWELL
jgi:hypothetical protein